MELLESRWEIGLDRMPIGADIPGMSEKESGIQSVSAVQGTSGAHGGSWRDKAHAIIAAECRRSYEQANRLPNGRLRRRHVPYTVPALAQQMIDYLGRDAEHEAKAEFVRLAVCEGRSGR